jgi:peptidyl-prolyl cis-trans isomerase SurA
MSFIRQATRRLVAATVLAGIAGAAVAQTVTDRSVPQTGLDIPENLQIFGKLDPNVRKPTAIVNDTVITGTDVDQRLALIALANNTTAGALQPEERDRLKLQILRQLIDETLQVQEARVADVIITPAEINQSYEQLARRQFQSTPRELTQKLAAAGSSERSLRRQIEGELAWSRYLRRRVEPLVNVGETEVKAILARLEAQRGTQEFAVKEIVLRTDATGSNTQQVYTNARQLIAEIQKGQRPFEYFASQFSEATTKSTGGDLGWVRATTLPPQLAEALQTMTVGQVAGPIEADGSFSILYLTDKRQVGAADPRDAVLSLKQVGVNFPAGISQADATARAAAFGTAMKDVKGCGGVDAIARRIGAEVVQRDDVRIRDINEPRLQQILLQLQVGEATPAFGSPQEGVRSLVLCGRDDARATAALPSTSQVQNQLEQQRVNLRAQQKMRDLRRDAVVEYR